MSYAPGLGALMTIFLLSLGGFPPLAGFIAKWYVFSAAIKAGYVWLAIIGVLTSVVSVFFYLRIVVMMYMTEETAAPARPSISVGVRSWMSVDRMTTLTLSAIPLNASSASDR